MDSIDNYLRKIFVAGVGAADIGYEKLSDFARECVKRGELTVEKGRAMNEELKHKCKTAAADGKKADIDLEKLSEQEREELLEKLMKMKENKD